jgi:hypothetical protein
MNKSQTLVRIKEAQRRWSDARKIEREGDSVIRLENNLYQPLTSQTRAQYERGDGGELGKDGKRGKMFALRSSSALVCNVFDYWRGRAFAPLLEALRIGNGISEIALEQKFRTGLKGNPPNRLNRLRYRRARSRACARPASVCAYAVLRHCSEQCFCHGFTGVNRVRQHWHRVMRP